MEEFKDQPKQMGKKIDKVTISSFKSREGDEEMFNKNIEESETLHKSNLPDIAEKLFGEINPLKYDVPDLKKSLEREVVGLEDSIRVFEDEESRYNWEKGYNKKRIDECKKAIIGKKWWIMKIDDYLLGRNTVDLEKIQSSPN